MIDPISISIISVTTILAIGLSALVGLKGWQQWIDYKRTELDSRRGDPDLPPVGGRIEMADLKERIRKLEAIAEGIDI